LTNDPQIILNVDVVAFKPGDEIAHPGLDLGTDQRLWNIEFDLVEHVLHNLVLEDRPLGVHLVGEHVLLDRIDELIDR